MNLMIKKLTEESRSRRGFPDINDVPQIKPEFEEIDENFLKVKTKKLKAMNQMITMLKSVK